MLSVVATTLTTPDTTRTLTVTVNGVDLTSAVKWDSLTVEDQGTAVQGTTSFLVTASQATYARIIDQALVTIEDHLTPSSPAMFRGFVDSRKPVRLPTWSEVSIVASDHTSLLDVVIPYELRPAGESDAGRIGYLWGLYSGEYLSGDFTYVKTVDASMPAQQFAGVTLRQALDLIAAQASTSAFWYLDAGGRLHYNTTETNDAPKNVTSDTPAAGEIAPMDLSIDADSKGYVWAVYVRGKTVDGSGWVYNHAARVATNGVRRTTFLDAPDCTDSTMRDALGNAYLAKLGSAIERGSFTAQSRDADGWRAGQNVTVRSTHLGNLNTAYRIARVRTSIMGPLGTRPAGLRRYDVEFGAASDASTGSTGPTLGTGIVGDYLGDGGSLLLGSGTSSTTSGFGPAIRRFITSGVYNGDFSLLPPYADSTIVQTWNPLPYWTFVQSSGTAITATSVADGTSGSGRVIRFDMTTGAAGDDAYLEQYIPVNGTRNRQYAYYGQATFLTGSTVSAAVMYLYVDYLDSSRSPISGTGGTMNRTTTAIGANTLVTLSVPGGALAAVPTNAAFMRFRVGYKRDAAATSTVETVTLTEAALITGASTVLVQEALLPSTIPSTRGPLEITQTGGNAALVANQGGSSGSAPSLKLVGTDSNPLVQLSANSGTPLFRYGGTAFPSGAPLAANDLFYRTDLGGWYFYDGTRWLSETEYVMPLVYYNGGSANDQPVSTSPILMSRLLVPTDISDIYIIDWRWVMRLGATNSGTAYWTYVLEKVTLGIATTQIASDNTSANSANTTVEHVVTINAALGTTNRFLQSTISKTGSPTSVDLMMESIRYRRIAT